MDFKAILEHKFETMRYMHSFESLVFFPSEVSGVLTASQNSATFLDSYYDIPKWIISQTKWTIFYTSANIVFQFRFLMSDFISIEGSLHNHNLFLISGTWQIIVFFAWLQRLLKFPESLWIVLLLAPLWILKLPQLLHLMQICIIVS